MVSWYQTVVHKNLCGHASYQLYLSQCRWTSEHLEYLKKLKAEALGGCMADLVTSIIGRKLRCYRTKRTVISILLCYAKFKFFNINEQFFVSPNFMD